VTTAPDMSGQMRATGRRRSPASGGTPGSSSGSTSPRNHVERLDLLFALTAIPTQDPAADVQAMAQTITRALGVDRADVMRYDSAEDALISLGASDVRPAGEGERKELERLPLRDVPRLASVLRTGTPYLTLDVGDEPAMPPQFARAGMRSILALPLVIGGERQGIVYVAGREAASFSQEAQALLAMIAARIGLLIEHAEIAERRAELERERARQQARQEFVGIVSHELKTPVTVIKAYAEALLHRAVRAGDAYLATCGRAGGEDARPD